MGQVGSIRLSLGPVRVSAYPPNPEWGCFSMTPSSIELVSSLVAGPVTQHRGRGLFGPFSLKGCLSTSGRSALVPFLAGLPISSWLSFSPLTSFSASFCVPYPRPWAIFHSFTRLISPTFFYSVTHSCASILR
jgi:hypothetical protein